MYAKMARVADLERFARKVERDRVTGCLLWTDSTFQNGYGRIQVAGKSVGAHRWIFGQDHGYLPPVVMHVCDNPPCVELTHLIPGTHADNQADKVAKGRQARGENCGRSKLTDAQVAEIRIEYARGVLTQSALGEIYGVSQTQIGRIARRPTCPGK